MLSFQITRYLNDLETFGKGEFTSLIEGSIEVFSEEACTVVACHYAIGIEHGHYIEDVNSTELFGYWFGASEIL